MVYYISGETIANYIERRWIVNTDFYNIQFYMTRLAKYVDTHFLLYSDIQHTDIIKKAQEEPYAVDCINVKRDVQDMTRSDLLFVASLLKSDCCDDGLIIIRYNEIAAYNSEGLKEVEKKTGLGLFDIYHGLLREARSYVYDLVNNRTASVPFYKFMNIDQCKGYTKEEVCQRIKEADRVEYTEKMDGCFVQMFAYDGINYLTTACSINREYDVADSPVRDAIVEYLNENDKLRDSLLDILSEYDDYTFIFEAVLPETHIIVDYAEEDYGLYLIGARNKIVGTLKDRRWLEMIASKYNLKKPNSYHGDTNGIDEFNQITETLCQAKGNEMEGVVANIDGFLVKMKSNDYFNLVGFKKTIGSKDVVIKAYVEGRLDDLISVTPKSVIGEINEIVSDITEYNNACKCVFNWYIRQAFKNNVKLKDVHEFTKGCPQCVRNVIADYLYRILKQEQPRKWNYLFKKGSSVSGQHGYIKYNELKVDLNELRDFLYDKG